MPEAPPRLLPPDLLADAWHRLQQGKADADHPFRTAALATADALGTPDVRTVVLRRVDPIARVIEFQTDRRSPKFATLQRNATAGWCFYDAKELLQLRIRTTAALHTHDAVADDAWALIPDEARRPYCGPLMPGAALDGPAAPPPDPTVDGRTRFCVVRCAVEALEWLKRDDDGWHRVHFTWPNGEVQWQWLCP